MIGVILGFAGRLLFEGIQMAGQLVGFQMGFSIVNIIDPVTSEQVSIIAEFQYLLAGLLFLAVDGHHLLLQAVSESYTVVPVLGFHLTGALMQNLVDLTREMFVVAMKISAPIIVALVFANIGLGLVARTVPQINIFVVGFPLQIAIGLLGIGLTVPVFLHVTTGLFSGLSGQIAPAAEVDVSASRRGFQASGFGIQEKSGRSRCEIIRFSALPSGTKSATLFFPMHLL